jgi:TatD DNase family protein
MVISRRNIAGGELTRPPQYSFIDTHTHLYDGAFQADLPAVLERARQVGVQRFYLPNIDTSTIGPMFSLVERYPSHCFPMLGLHPAEVKANYLEELDTIKPWLNHPRLVAIGEVGLDLYHSKAFEQEQIKALNIQAGWAALQNLPLICHSRSAEGLLAGLLGELKKKQPTLRGVFHSFTGSLEEAEQVIALGFYLGINGIVTYGKRSSQRVLVENLPLDHFVLETDSPWLPPTPYRGQRSEPAHIHLIAQEIAKIKGIALEEVAATTSKNAQLLFGTFYL